MICKNRKIQKIFYNNEFRNFLLNAIVVVGYLALTTVFCIAYLSEIKEDSKK